jgi:hypothetical protein
LIHDCQYTDDEYPTHAGWGHSGVSDALTFGRRVGAKRMLLFHHDPLHADEFLDDLHASARRRWQQLGGDAVEIDMGMEGAELVIDEAVRLSAPEQPPIRPAVQGEAPQVSTSG